MSGASKTLPVLTTSPWPAARVRRSRAPARPKSCSGIASCVSCFPRRHACAGSRPRLRVSISCRGASFGIVGLSCRAIRSTRARLPITRSAWPGRCCAGCRRPCMTRPAAFGARRPRCCRCRARRSCSDSEQSEHRSRSCCAVLACACAAATARRQMPCFRRATSFSTRTIGAARLRTPTSWCWPCRWMTTRATASARANWVSCRGTRS